jgi:hypothetical protein
MRERVGPELIISVVCWSRRVQCRERERRIRSREKRAEMLCVTWLLYQRVMAENSRVNSPVVLNYTRSCARASERGSFAKEIEETLRLLANVTLFDASSHVEAGMGYIESRVLC